MHSMPMTLPQIRPALSLWGRGPEDAPSAAVVAAVLSFGDVRIPSDDGTETIRFSTERVRREDIQLLLGAQCRRALDVSVVWDDRRMELVKVLDQSSLDTFAVRDAEGQGYARAKGRDFPRELDF